MKSRRRRRSHPCWG